MLSNGDRVSVFQDERVLEVGRTMTGMQILLNGTHKLVKFVDFMCSFPQLKILKNLTSKRLSEIQISSCLGEGRPLWTSVSSNAK